MADGVRQVTVVDDYDPLTWDEAEYGECRPDILPESLADLDNFHECIDIHFQAENATGPLFLSTGGKPFDNAHPFKFKNRHVIRAGSFLGFPLIFYLASVAAGDPGLSFPARLIFCRGSSVSC